MPTLPASRRVLTLLLMLFSVVGPLGGAFAQEEAETGGAEPVESAAEEELTWQVKLDNWFGENVVTHLENVLFWPVYTREVPGHEPSALPLIVCVLVFGGLFFTTRYGFINVRLFKHSVDVIRGKFDRPEDAGEVSHFQALTSALSATVGLGNIAGVAIAISLGGPGALFWMWFTAFFGMSMKFSSCTFAHLYRKVHPDGRVMGGPMVYLEQGIAERFPALFPLAKAMAVIFALFTIGAAFGAGNMYQTNQTAAIFANQFFGDSEAPLLKLGMGITMAFLAGIVIIGGISRIGEITARLVPSMCAFYCIVCMIILVLNYQEIPHMFATIFAGAFQAEAVYGGFLGVLVQGMRRAAFSNEAGLGSAAIAHAAARTKEPVREGIVAMLEPFVDTICVCTMTALAILVTNAHIEAGEFNDIRITAYAFAQLGPLVPYILCLAVFVFAYSTMITWGYYGERATEYLFGLRGILPYRVVYVAAIIIGPLLSLNNVLGFGDILLLSMAFPNILGMLLISRKVKDLTDDYLRRLNAGEMPFVK